jgi:hypothetical protein
MNGRWDGPFKISQNGPGTPMSPPTETRKWAKTKIFFKSFFFRTETGSAKKIMVL